MDGVVLERVEKAVLQYKVRLGKMDDNRWARKVYEWTSLESRWKRATVKIKRKCELERFTQSEVMLWLGINELNTTVNERVQERECGKWAQSLWEKSSVEWYRRKTQPKSECFYDGSMGSELPFKARTKSLEVNSRVYRWAN